MTEEKQELSVKQLLRLKSVELAINYINVAYPPDTRKDANIIELSQKIFNYLNV